MKTNILSLITIATAILLTSCEKEIEFNGEHSDPKLVINSLVEPGQPVKASIGKSCFFLDNEMDYSVPQGTVAQLFVNNNFVGNMDMVTDTIEVVYYTYYGDSVGYAFERYFQSDYRPQTGDVVKITASAPGFDDVEGMTSSLPNAVTCTVVGSQVSNWDSWGNEYEEDSIIYAGYELEVTLEITDPNPGKTDFFRISADRGSHYADDGINYTSYFPEYNDPIFTSLNSVDNEFVDFSDLNFAPQGVFTDLIFDGRSYQLKIPFSVSIKKHNDADPNFFRIAFTLEHLSKEYYNYLNTCNQGDEVMGFFAEPIQTYSNVVNGFGIVAGRTVDTLWMPLPLSPQE